MCKVFNNSRSFVVAWKGGFTHYNIYHTSFKITLIIPNTGLYNCYHGYLPCIVLERPVSDSNRPWSRHTAQTEAQISASSPSSSSSPVLK